VRQLSTARIRHLRVKPPWATMERIWTPVDCKENVFFNSQARENDAPNDAPALVAQKALQALKSPPAKRSCA